jgi:hypothetical protein
MNEETTNMLHNAVIEMARNALVDEALPTYIAVTVYCEHHDNFHFHAFSGNELLGGLDAFTLMSAMMFAGDHQDIIVQSCKGIGAELAKDSKTALAVTLIACGLKADREDPRLSGKSNEEIMGAMEDFVKSGKSEAKIDPNMMVATHALPNFYRFITYDVELIGENDTMLTGKIEMNDPPESDDEMFRPHEALLESANFLSGIQRIFCSSESEDDTPLSGDNEAKFRSFISKIEHSFSIEDVL